MEAEERRAAILLMQCGSRRYLANKVYRRKYGQRLRHRREYVLTYLEPAAGRCYFNRQNLHYSYALNYTS